MDNMTAYMEGIIPGWADFVNDVKPEVEMPIRTGRLRIEKNTVAVPVKYIPTNYELGLFFGRLWIRNLDKFWYPMETNFCPHLYVSGGECRDCSLVIEGDE